MARRPLTEREIVNSEQPDLSNVRLQRGDAANIPGASGGGTTTQIGVPVNFKIVGQEVVSFDGEYRVNVIIEFDGVAGAEGYESRLNLVEL